MVSSSFLLVGVYMREVDDGWILQFSFGRNIFVKCIYGYNNMVILSSIVFSVIN